MVRSDFHMHSSFSDGKNTQEEMVLAALAKGFERIGFSEHAYTVCDDSCMTVEGTAEYKAATKAIKEKYRGKIDIYCGIEQDYFSSLPTDDYDYVIGSVHFIQVDGEYHDVDNTPEMVRNAIEKVFAGDNMRFAEEYFRTVSDVYRKTRCDIVGHFDLVTKYNDRCGFFDTSDSRYIRAWKAAAAELLDEGCRLFEINTGVIPRGHKTSPYPSLEICRFLSERGAGFVLSGDAHKAENIGYAFDYWKDQYENAGLKVIEFIPQK